MEAKYGRLPVAVGNCVADPNPTSAKGRELRSGSWPYCLGCYHSSLPGCVYEPLAAVGAAPLDPSARHHSAHQDRYCDDCEWLLHRTEPSKYAHLRGQPEMVSYEKQPCRRKANSDPKAHRDVDAHQPGALISSHYPYLNTSYQARDIFWRAENQMPLATKGAKAPRYRARYRRRN